MPALPSEVLRTELIELAGQTDGVWIQDRITLGASLKVQKCQYRHEAQLWNAKSSLRVI